MIEFVFWTMVACVVYVYAGYPLLLVLVRSVLGSKPVRGAEYTPRVTMIISAYNEAAVIGDKLANSLYLAYPPDKLEFLVVSDASTDGTDAIVTGLKDPRVHLLRMPERAGKTAGLNAAVERAQSEIVVFSDANAMYVPTAIEALVSNFADPDVGAVIGESTYSDANAPADESESLYWRYEVAIKRLESAIGSVVGGDGAIYAVRKTLYRPMRADALSDFVNPLQIVQSGHRCVYEPEAISIEKAAGDFDLEFRRKVRIVNRAWRATMTFKGLLNPLRYGFFALEIASHKLLRWLVPLFLIACFVANALLVRQHPLYATTFLAQVVLYSLALSGHFMRRRKRLPRVIAIPYYFVIVNFASARGIVEAYLGKTYTTWSTARATH